MAKLLNSHHYDPELDSTHFLIEEQVQNARAEFLVGVKRETGLGLALVIGRGTTVRFELPLPNEARGKRDGQR